MFEFVFILVAVGLGVWARFTHLPVLTACWWFGLLVGAFVLVRVIAQKVAILRLSNRFDDLYGSYNDKFGSTASGRQFLDDVQPWYEGLRSSLGVLEFFDDWRVVVAGHLAAAVAEHLDGRTPEQRALEHEIRSVTSSIEKRREQFSGTMWLTPMAILAVAVATQTDVLGWMAGHGDPVASANKPSETRVAPPEAGPQFTTAEKAQKVAVQRYPQLGVAGSTLNTAFVNRYRLYQQTRPEYFRDAAWPIRLAEEVAASNQSKSDRGVANYGLGGR